ncbi:uncharacterized protein N7477_001885 [Penicillium maclennaniae]|uniref:uncharacterized protein n=1 Tax=Penicillium maclennaniae TaxID=1343394 RepID=UPI00253FC1C2|nr:uncharacterized protein N7477_001885 [Penicillium maclennaniae]KAJ5681945.1 hypothetical protein N7477_001885 [Penicillium maclennaniae]
MTSRGPEEQETIACSTLGTATSSEVLAEDLRQFTRSPHPYHRSRRLGSRTPSEQGDRLHLLSFSKASRTSSESGTEADDESTGILKGLPAPPVRPHKGLRAAGNGALDSDTWLPSLKPWPSFVRSTRGSRGSSEEEADGNIAEKSRSRRRRRVEILRRLMETALLLSVGGVVLLQRDARLLAWAWRKGKAVNRHSM